MAPTHEPLVMYTVYEHPRDYPDEFVIRRCAIGPGTITPDRTLFARGPTLESVRDQLPRGLVCLRRLPDDEPQIVEVWT